jgi:heat shock protein HtpX
MARPFVRIGAHQPLSTVAASSKSMTPTPSRRFFLSALPAASYATLGCVGLAAVRLVQPVVLAWKGVQLLAGCIGLPMLRTLVPVLFMGGSGIFKRLGVTQAPSWITALAKDAADAVGVLPPVHVFLIPGTKEPNAFATGFTDNDMSVTVTQGLVDVLDKNEIRAVLAHEMGHLQHRDVQHNMHIAIAAAGLGSVYEAGHMLLDAGRRKKGSKKRSEKGDGSGLAIALMTAGPGTQAMTHLLRLFASRSAELRADEAAARAFGAQTLINALQKIYREGAMISDGSIASSAPARSAPATWMHLVRNGVVRIAGLLRTHPTLEERVSALSHLAI